MKSELLHLCLFLLSTGIQFVFLSFLTSGCMTLFFVSFAVANRQLHKRQHVMHRVQYHGAIFKGPDPGHCDLLFLMFCVH